MGKKKLGKKVHRRRSVHVQQNTMNRAQIIVQSHQSGMKNHQQAVGKERKKNRNRVSIPYLAWVFEDWRARQLAAWSLCFRSAGKRYAGVLQTLSSPLARDETREMRAFFFWVQILCNPFLQSLPAVPLVLGQNLKKKTNSIKRLNTSKTKAPLLATSPTSSGDPQSLQRPFLNRSPLPAVLHSRTSPSFLFLFLPFFLFLLDLDKHRENIYRYIYIYIKTNKYTNNLTKKKIEITKVGLVKKWFNVGLLCGFRS